MNPLRTLLFAPGNRIDRVEKALSLDADGVIIDLEDTIPFSEKEMARKLVKDLLNGINRKNIYVRCNGLDTDYLEGDIKEIVCRQLTGFVVPKVVKKEDIFQLDRLITAEEERTGLQPGSVGVIPFIESAQGVENIYAIASARPKFHRVMAAAFGAADYTLDIGSSLSRDGVELLYPRSRLVVACRAGGLAPPIDSPWMIDLKDIDGLIAEAKQAKQLGFQGKLVIHPNQIAPVNEIFTPSPDEVEHASRVEAAFREAEERGTAAVVLDGKFIDYPVVEKSRRVLALAEAIAQKER